MRSFLSSIVAPIAGAVAAFLPLFPSFIPHLGAGIYYRLRELRLALVITGLITGLGAYVRRPTRRRLWGLLLTGAFAGIAQRLHPKNIFVALDEPPHVPAGEAALPDHALVLGTNVDDVARAWPLDVLVPRHLINDRVSQTPVLAAY